VEFEDGRGKVGDKAESRGRVWKTYIIGEVTSIVVGKKFRLFTVFLCGKISLQIWEIFLPAEWQPCR